VEVRSLGVKASAAQSERLLEIVAGNRWLTDVLDVVRLVGPPNWVVGAGVIRSVVWDHLHGYDEPTPVNDVDVAFFDPDDATRERDVEVERRLADRMPEVPWEVTNQAGVHLWYEAKFGYPIRPLESIEDAVSMWPETATSVGVTVDEDGTPRVVAPLGLDDLLGMVLRRNTRQVTYEYFLERLHAKRITERWPLVRVVDG
jgi:uncharacterized protein